MKRIARPPDTKLNIYITETSQNTSNSTLSSANRLLVTTCPQPLFSTSHINWLHQVKQAQHQSRNLVLPHALTEEVPPLHLEMIETSCEEVSFDLLSC